MTPQRRVRIDVLGPLRFRTGDQDANLPTGRPRELLEALLADPDRRRSADDVAEMIWPTVGRRIGRRRLQQVTSRLRRSLPDGAELTLRDGILELHVATDIDDFVRLADAAPQRALDIWRGTAFEDFADTPAVRHNRRRLHALRDRTAEASTTRATGPSTTPAAATPRPVFDDVEIFRPRLLAALPVAGQRRLIALVGPGGSGKSTLLRQWVDSMQAQTCWIDVTPEHNSAATFTTAVHGAVRTMTSEGRFADSSSSGPTDLNAVVNDLCDHPTPTVIVLDGVEHLQHKEAQAALADLVRLVPAHVTVGIATRRQLPNSISRSATSTDSVTLGPNELAFTTDELGEIAARLAPTVSSRLLAEIHRRTRGWAEAALEVLKSVDASLAASDRSGIDRRGDEGAGDDAILSHIPGEFLDRVLRDVDRADMKWLVAVSHLDILDFDLAEAVTGTPTRPHIARLSVDHCLLDLIDGRAVPRPPLGYLLRRRQREQPSAARQAHSRASSWCLANDRPSAALDHALASTDRALISSAATPALPAAVEAADATRLRRWLSALGPDIELAPGVLLAAHVATALCARDERRALRRLLGGETVAVDVGDVIELWSDARCGAALQQVVQVRDRIDQLPYDVPAAVTAFLDTAERECEILLDSDDSSARGRPEWLRDTEATPIAWLRVRSYGLLALGAYLGGDHSAATVLLERAESDATDVHASGRHLVGAPALLTRALIEADRPQRSPSDASITELERATERADHDGQQALSIGLRYATSRLHRRGGNNDDADRTLAEADERLNARSDLALLTKLRDRCAAGGAGPNAREGLTPRERIVLERLDSDLTLVEIADALFASVHTVRSQVRSIYRKLGVSRRADAVDILRGMPSSET